MKKIHVIILSLFLIISTSGLTFLATTMVQVDLGDKVVISKSDFEGYQTLINEYKDIENLRKYIKSNYYLEVEDEILIEGMKKGLFSALGDPYSQFMNADEFKSYMESSSGEYPGIGVYLAPNDDNEIEIVAPIEDTPADRAGLKAKDLIIAVNGETVNASVMDETISKVKGEPGTPVTLTIYRPSAKEKFDIEIIREWIDIKVVKSRMLDKEIGYIRISMFDSNVASEFEKHMKELAKKGAKGLVLDLRQNPGGYLQQCVEIADQLLGTGIIVYTESRNGDDEIFKSKGAKTDAKIVILVDQGSASASEILTAALKENDAATVIGTTTYGKGLVQVVRPYGKDNGFKLTTSQYFTPDGNNIHKVGIVPDIIEPLNESYFEIEKPTDEDDNQLQKAIEVLRTKLN